MNEGIKGTLTSKSQLDLKVFVFSCGLPASLWVLPGKSTFLPQSTNTLVRVTIDSRLTVGVHTTVCGSLS